MSGQGPSLNHNDHCPPATGALTQTLWQQSPFPPRITSPNDLGTNKCSCMRHGAAPNPPSWTPPLNWRQQMPLVKVVGFVAVIFHTLPLSPPSPPPPPSCENAAPVRTTRAWDSAPPFSACPSRTSIFCDAELWMVFGDADPCGCPSVQVIMHRPGTEVVPLLVSSEGVCKQRHCWNGRRRCFHQFECFHRCSCNGGRECVYSCSSLEFPCASSGSGVAQGHLAWQASCTAQGPQSDMRKLRRPSKHQLLVPNPCTRSVLMRRHLLHSC